jgi:bacteriocin biosynthesis cyclodehydratase domain-containing protein
LAAAQRLLHQVPAGMEVDEIDTGPPRQLLDALAQRGVLAGPGTAGRRAVGTVWVDGDNPIGRRVAQLLHGEVRVVVGPIDEGAVASADVVVACAGWLPDAAWRKLDQWCTSHGTPWHMSYAEGTRWYLGPMAVPGTTASYEDVRGRRLAACGVPEELLAYWGYLDSTIAAPPVPWPSAGAAAVVAGLIVNDILTWRDTATIAAQGFQLSVDPATAEVAQHPVLPLPRVAEREPS